MQGMQGMQGRPTRFGAWNADLEPERWLIGCGRLLPKCQSRFSNLGLFDNSAAPYIAWMLHSSHSDLPLRELCFDFSAGVIQRDQFHALAQAMLSRRMSCERVQIRCVDLDAPPVLARMKETGWLTETLGDGSLLHTALVHNGRPVGVLTCVRPAPGVAWTAADGLALRRYANVLASGKLCPISGNSQFVEKEGISL